MNNADFYANYTFHDTKKGSFKKPPFIKNRWISEIEINPYSQ